MQTVIIAKNPLEPETWVKHECADIRDLLVSEFVEWPTTARIYHEQVAQDRDVTPHTEAEVERLATLEGRLYVVVYPGDPISILIAVVAAVAVAALTLLFLPAIPTLRNQQQQSPNNSLSDRTNQPRPGQRIPDIFGTVRSTPDLLAVPYKIFKDNREVEVAYMCVGRGAYDISDIRDDTTPAGDIDGMSVEVYGPNTSPKSGDPAEITIGDAITDELIDVKRSNAINGQTLNAPNYKTVRGSLNFLGSGNIRFAYPNFIRSADEDIVDWTDYFEPGDIVDITGAQDTDGAFSVDLDGTYEVSTVGEKVMSLVSPNLVNSDWDVLDDFSDDNTDWIDPTIASPQSVDIGPFDVFLEPDGALLVNLVALNGMFKDDGKNQVSASVTVEFELTPINEAGTVVGIAETYSETITGSSTTRSTRGKTVEVVPTFTGYTRVVVRRLTDLDRSFDGTVVDETKIRDLYVVKPVVQTDFGNVTTVLAVTYGTDGALAIKERKLNMLATRKVPARTGPTTFGALTASNSAADIICAMALDPNIGNRVVAELDVDNIYDTIDEIADYFNTTDASEFSYTFDDDRLSFEESITTIAAAVFCQAYRVGSTIKLSFEKATPDSVLLFNHRNKIPGSEKRTVTFGRSFDYDGVQYQYISPQDDAVITYYIPADMSAVNSKKIESVGVRTDAQAYFHAWRAWNKIRYQNTAVEFEATQEADMLIIQDRILVADNTRPDTQDGQVNAQDGLELTLSQPVTFEMGVNYTIHLQHIDGTVQALGIAEGSTPYKVILDGAPSAALSLDQDNYAVALYQIIGDTDARATPFLVQEKNPKSNFNVGVSAINYDARYYENDLDFAAFFDTTLATFDSSSLTWDNTDG